VTHKPVSELKPGDRVWTTFGPKRVVSLIPRGTKLMIVALDSPPNLLWAPDLDLSDWDNFFQESEPLWVPPGGLK
jgi:hypothetical protein